MAKRRTFGQLSKSSRERAVRAGEVYGLSRKQVRDRYNRGSFNPFARTRPELRVPQEVRQYQSPASGEIDWKEAALANVRYHLSDYFKYEDFSVVEQVYEHASPEALKAMALMSEDELISLAHVQDQSEFLPNLPRGLTTKDIGYYKNHEWHNIFWYH